MRQTRSAMALATMMDKSPKIPHVTTPVIQANWLPSECLLMIFQHCNPQTLCNVRLTCKELLHLSQPSFWHTIRLVPNVGCLTDFANVAQGAVGAFVRHLIYDVSWQFLNEEFKALAEHPERRQPVATCEERAKSATSWLARCHREALDPTRDKCTEVIHIRNILRGTRGLQEITIDDDSQSLTGNGSIPPYYRQVCHKAEISAPATAYEFMRFNSCEERLHCHTSNLLIAVQDFGSGCRNYNLKKLRFEGLFGTSGLLSKKPAPSHDFLMQLAVFTNMKRLSLSLDSFSYPDSHMTQLQRLLRKCNALEGLKLSFMTTSERVPSKKNRNTSMLAGLLNGRPPRRPLLRSLVALHLNQMVCTERDLVLFLSQHSATLRHLRISNTTLVSESGSPRHGCWIAVIRAIRSHLNLESIRFSDWLSNGGRQCWYIPSERADPGRIRPQVERYITDSSATTCPIEHVAIQDNQDDVSVAINGSEEEGDWTWTMTYAGSRGWPRRNAMVCGMDHFSKDTPLEASESQMFDSQYWKKPDVTAKHPSKNKVQHFDFFDDMGFGTTGATHVTQGHATQPPLHQMLQTHNLSAPSQIYSIVPGEPQSPSFSPTSPSYTSHQMPTSIWDPPPMFAGHTYSAGSSSTPPSWALPPTTLSHSSIIMQAQPPVQPSSNQWTSSPDDLIDLNTPEESSNVPLLTIDDVLAAVPQDNADLLSDDDGTFEAIPEHDSLSSDADDWN